MPGTAIQRGRVLAAIADSLALGLPLSDAMERGAEEARACGIRGEEGRRLVGLLAASAIRGAA